MAAAVYILVVAVCAFALRYGLRLWEACLYIGGAVSDSQLQDTPPPVLAKRWPASLVMLITAIVHAVWSLGWIWAIVLLIEGMLVASITALVLPKCGAPYWTRVIYSSLGHQTSNFKNQGDELRFRAGLTAIKRIEERFGEQLNPRV